MNKKLPAILSVFIWGLGQVVNRQWYKGLVLFAIQLIVVVTELNTGYYIEYLSGAISGAWKTGLYGGFFGKGIWGIITLGDTPRIVTDNGITMGDHSIILMIQGIFTLIVLFLVICIFIGNILDAYIVAQKISRGETVSTKPSLGGLFAFIEKYYPYVVLSPIIVGLLVFSLVPILFSFLVAFTNYNINNLPPVNLVDWVGLRNFFDIFQVPIWSSTFLGVLEWNIIFMIVATLEVIIFGMLQAIILNNKRVLFPRFWRSILILPWAMPALISQLIFKALFNGQFGPINRYLMDLGLISDRIPWLTDPFYAKLVIFIVNLWLGFPYWMILIAGVMTSIEPSLYEASKLDGANPWQEFRYITLPQIMVAISPLMIMSFAGNFNNFGLIYFLTNGNPPNPTYQFAGQTDILISWIYKLTLDQRFYNMASVMSILIFIFVGTVSLLNLQRTRAFKDNDE